MSDDLELDTKNLDDLLKTLKASMGKARVGILGDKASRNGEAVQKGRSVSAKKGVAPKGKEALQVTNNAALGAIHEFGMGGMPQRSFLRVPIAEHLQKRLEDAGAFSDDEMKKVLKEKSMRPWLERISKLAEAIVTDAFDTGGFGKWPKWKSKGYTNNTGQILVDTQQLRNSITSEVE